LGVYGGGYKDAGYSGDGDKYDECAAAVADCDYGDAGYDDDNAAVDVDDGGDEDYDEGVDGDDGDNDCCYGDVAVDTNVDGA